jgi:hypothetical protein
MVVGVRLSTRAVDDNVMHLADPRPAARMAPVGPWAMDGISRPYELTRGSFLIFPAFVKVRAVIHRPVSVITPTVPLRIPNAVSHHQGIPACQSELPRADRCRRARHAAAGRGHAIAAVHPRSHERAY